MQVLFGICIESCLGCVCGSFDYLFNGIFYIKMDVKNQMQNLLFVNGIVELIENSLFVDVQVSIGQQVILVFGQQFVNSLLRNVNCIEVGIVSVLFYWCGWLFNIVSVEVCVSVVMINIKELVVGDSYIEGVLVCLNGFNVG